MNQALQASETQQKSLAKTFAAKYDMEPKAMMSTLKQTAFKQKNGEVSDAQMAMLMLVANEYNLNPFTKEIYAFPDKGGIVPIVGVDGWSRIINDHPQFDGLEFKASEEMVTPNGGKSCPEWMEVHIYRKDRSRPVVIREYLDEVYKKTQYDSPWQSHTKRFLRHKTLIQGARIAFGYTGIYDEDEASNIIEGRVVSSHEPEQKTNEVIEAAAAIESHSEELSDVELVIKKLSSATDRAELDLILADAGGYELSGDELERVTAVHADRINELSAGSSKLEMNI